MPFQNLSGNPQEAFLANGLHKDMISVINRLYPDRLGVIAYDSTKRYEGKPASIAQIGQDLKVDYVVEGGVQRNGLQAHVAVELIRVKDQVTVWNATYDRDLSQIVAAQFEIAQAVGQRIGRSLQPDAQVSAALMRPLNAAAHEAYLRGDYAKAVQLDPGYAAAFAGLASQLYLPGLLGFLPPSRAFTGISRAASRAVELDPTQASAYGSLALSKLHQQWNWSGAEQDFRHALRIDPGNAEVRHYFAHFLLWANRPDESARECNRAVELDPFNPDLVSCLGWHDIHVGDFDGAVEWARRALTLQQDHPWALVIMGWAYEQKQMFQESLAALRKTVINSALKTSSIAHVFARSGNRAEAEKILEDMLARAKTTYVSPYDVAVTYAGLNDKEHAFEWLNKAFDEHSAFMVYMSSDPRLRELRPDPPFQDLLQRMGLRKQPA
jgi:TolB-like protein/Tfp pilus assembly protein PilF